MRISGVVIDRPRNMLGGAIVDEFETVLADPTIGFVVNLDADGQHDVRQMSDSVWTISKAQSAINGFGSNAAPSWCSVFR